MSKKIFWIDEAEHVFSVLQGALARNKAPIAIVYVKSTEDSLTVDQNSISSFVRTSDVVFHDVDKEGWWTILPNSGEKEVTAFLERFSQTFSTEYPSQQVFYTEVRDPYAHLVDVVKQLKLKAQKESESGVYHVEGSWTSGEKSTIRASLILNEPIVKEVLMRTLTTVEFPHFELEIQDFEDGYSFEQSDWYKTAHTHLVILDDVLPKKNGIEVVHYLRSLPNNQKFTIFMLTDRVSEENQINAYRMGIDEIIQKPFNLRLFEALFTRTIERLWS